MQGFQMLMNFLVMPMYFLSGAMFPIASAPLWMKTLMTLDPLTYGVDALREHCLFRSTVLGLRCLDFGHRGSTADAAGSLGFAVRCPGNGTRGLYFRWPGSGTVQQG